MKTKYYDENTINQWIKKIKNREIEYIQFDVQKIALKRIIFEDPEFLSLTGTIQIYEDYFHMALAELNVEIVRRYDGDVVTTVKHNHPMDSLLSDSLYNHGKRPVNHLLKHTLTLTGLNLDYTEE